MRAYLGQPADDAPERRSRALDAYLRHTWHTRPSAIAEAERQLREYSRNPPGRIRQELSEFYSIPDTGKPQSDIGNWLMVLADHLKRSIEEGDVPEPSSPQTHWEWHARFPETAQLLGAGSRRTSLTSSAATTPQSPTTPIPQTRSWSPASWANCTSCSPSPWTRGTTPWLPPNSAMEVGPPEPFSHGAWVQSLAATLSGV